MWLDEGRKFLVGSFDLSTIDHDIKGSRYWQTARCFLETYSSWSLLTVENEMGEHPGWLMQATYHCIFLGVKRNL